MPTSISAVAPATRRKTSTGAVLKAGCPSRLLLDLIADKWTVLVIAALDDEVVRFSELERRVEGISQKMLSQTLRKLESHKLITRKIYPVVPPRVEYQLSPAGRSLGEPLEQLCRWAERNMACVPTPAKTVLAKG